MACLLDADAFIRAKRLHYGFDFCPAWWDRLLAGEHLVVTHEVPSASPRRIKIPDVRVGPGIGCLTPFDTLRRESARFILSASS